VDRWIGSILQILGAAVRAVVAGFAVAADAVGWVASGCEELLGQVFNLGIESHDDLCDSLTYLLQGLAEQGLELPKIHWIEG
jgi:hypothetical protein